MLILFEVSVKANLIFKISETNNFVSMIFILFSFLTVFKNLFKVNIINFRDNTTTNTF